MVSRRRPVARNWRRHEDLPRSCAMGGSTLPVSWAILRESGIASVRRATRLPAPRALPGKPRRHYPGRRDAPGIFHKTEDDASRRPKAAGPACPRHDSSAFRRGDGGKHPSFLLHCIPDLFIGEPQARANSDRPAVSAGRCADRPPLASSSWP